MTNLKKTFSLTLVATILFCAVCSYGQEGALTQAPFAKEKWSLNTPDKLLWMQTTVSNDLIVSTEKELFCLDGVTGVTKWQRKDIANLAVDYFNPLQPTPYACLSQIVGIDSVLLSNAKWRKTNEGNSDAVKKLEKQAFKVEIGLLDCNTGSALWNCHDWITDVKGEFLLPQINGLLIYGHNITNLRPSIALADLNTGALKWINDSLYTETTLPKLFENVSRLEIRGNQYPVWLNDSTFLELFSSNGLRKIDARTGKVLWISDVKFNSVPALAKGFPQMQLSKDEKFVYVPNEKGLVKVNILDGKSMWKKSSKFPSHVSEFEITDSGIIILKCEWFKSNMLRGFITAINESNGEVVWKKPFNSYNVTFTVVGEKLVVSDGRSNTALKTINISDGKPRVLSKKVRIKEFPSLIEPNGSNFTLLSSNTISVWDTVKGLASTSYFPPPRENTLSIIGKIAGMMVMGAAMGYASGGLYSYIPTSGVGPARFRASSFRPENVYMLTNVEGGSAQSANDTGLIKVNKETGIVEKRVKLGIKKPKYILDSSKNHLFFLSGDNQITCYDF